jgi:hypothetical protein
MGKREREEGRAYLQRGWDEKARDFGQMQREEGGEKPWQTSSSFFFFFFFFVFFLLLLILRLPSSVLKVYLRNGPPNSNLTLKRTLNPNPKKTSKP